MKKKTVYILKRSWGQTSPRLSPLKTAKQRTEDGPCEFATSVIFDLPKAVTGKGGLLMSAKYWKLSQSQLVQERESQDQESNWKDLEDSECLAGTDPNPGG